jgi:hypothetical protein
LTLGGAAQTGLILIGQSTGAQTCNIATGATATATTKAINIGVGGLAGSTTTIAIGPVTATTAAGTVTFNTATTVAIANTGASALSVAGNITGGNLNTGGLISVTGNITSADFAQFANVIITGARSANINVAGVGIRTVASTYTDNTTAASGTAADNHINVLSTPTLAATNLTVTSTRAATLYIAGAPAAGTNMTITNAYALYAAAGNVVAIANITGGNLLTGGLVSATGNITANNFSTSGSGGSLTCGGPVTFSTGSGAINIGTSMTTGTVTIGGTGATGTLIFGQSTGTQTCNIATGVSSGVTKTVNIGTQGDVTSNTVITMGAAAGNANVNFTANTVLAIANTGGSALSVAGNITGGNVIFGTGQVTGTGNITGGNLNAAGLSLTSNVVSALNVTGNIAAGNVTTPGLISATGNVNGGNIITGAILQGATLSATGAVTFSATTQNINIGTSQTTGTITLGGTTQTGLILIGQSTASQTANIATGATGSGNTKTINIGTSGVANSTTTITIAGGVAGNSTVTIGASTGNTTTSFTANTTVAIANTGGSALSVAGNITGGNITVSTGTVTLGNIVNANGNGIGNIGSSSLYFNTVFAKATSAVYADLAETYAADQVILPGTVVSFGGTHEVTVSTQAGDTRIAGVVSTNPSYVMNAGLDTQCPVVVALTGRVPTLVTGNVTKGDMMVSAGDGTACASACPAMGSVLGKALEDFSGTSGTIEIVVGRL